jgi:nucleotide-binding universal stress UspA family protein
LDGSEIGEAALQYVEEMISNLEAGERVKIILLHVLAVPIQRVEVRQNISIATPLTEEEIEEMKEKALEYLKTSGEGLKRIGVDVSYEVLVREAGASSAVEIIKAEEEFNIDLVAMSTHGRRGISRWAFGSVTEKVLRGGKVPVLVVRAKK